MIRRSFFGCLTAVVAGLFARRSVSDEERQADTYIKMLKCECAQPIREGREAYRHTIVDCGDGVTTVRWIPVAFKDVNAGDRLLIVDFTGGMVARTMTVTVRRPLLHPTDSLQNAVVIDTMIDHLA